MNRSKKPSRFSFIFSILGSCSILFFGFFGFRPLENVAMMLAATDRRPENIRVLSVIITELEFGDIKRHVFAAHFVECADDAALEDRPEALDGLSVDCANDILASRMVNSRMRVIPVERIVARILIGAKQTDFVGDGVADEGGKSSGIHVRDYPRDHISLAADSANDWGFAGTDAASSIPSASLIPMPVLGHATDESFIDLDNAAELINILHKSDADFVTHRPRCFVRTEAHIALNLQRAHAFLAGQHEVDNAIPVAKRFICVFEDRPGNMRKAIAVWRALFALPMPFAGRKIVNGWVAATRAANALWPAARDQVSFASLFVGEHFLELCDGQLMNGLGLFLRVSPLQRDTIMDKTVCQVPDNRPILTPHNYVNPSIFQMLATIWLGVKVRRRFTIKALEAGRC